MKNIPGFVTIGGLVLGGIGLIMIFIGKSSAIGSVTYSIGPLMLILAVILILAGLATHIISNTVIEEEKCNKILRMIAASLIMFIGIMLELSSINMLYKGTPINFGSIPIPAALLSMIIGLILIIVAAVQFSKISTNGQKPNQ